MKELRDYFKPVTVYLVPHLRNGNSLKVEFRPFYFREEVERFKDFISRLRKDFNFSCSESKSVCNTTVESNIIDISLPLYVDERAVINDLVEELEKILYDDYGENSVLDRTRSTIKKENNKMKA